MRVRERWEAQKTWPFLTDADLKAIRTPDDLTRIVSVRKGVALVEAETLVASWMMGHRRRLALLDDGRANLPPPNVAPPQPYW